MDRKKLLKLSVVVLIILLIVYFVLQLFSKQSSKEEVKSINIHTARKAAQDNLGAFEEWRGPTLEEWYTFYDLEGTPSAYLFNISDYYGRAGYIAISATTKMKPVIEISNSPKTPVAQILELANDITIGTIYKPSDVRTEYYYLGGTEYYVKMSLREGSEVTDTYYKIEENAATEVKESQVVSKQEFYETYQEEEAGEKWSEYIDNL
jgi:hypothetical protein